MAKLSRVKIPATFMRGGTSKGVFFKLSDLPPMAQVAGKPRDNFLLRIMGSPDPYGKQIDGLGGGSSSTSKVAIISKSARTDHDVDYLFGQVAIDKALIDWSGNCGNLTAAVGVFAINNGMLDANRIPENGLATVRIWQQNISKTLIVEIPIVNGLVQESGEFELAGVAFPAVEINVEFLDPIDAGGSIFPTGNPVDELNVVAFGPLQTTIINTGITTIIVNASDIDLLGTELQHDVNGNPDCLRLLENIRAAGALRIGLIDELAQAESCQHTPKIVFIAYPQSYTAANGEQVSSESIDLLARAVSMGMLHHAMMGTAAVALASAAVIPGTLVNKIVGGGETVLLRVGHPSGVMQISAQAKQIDEQWRIDKVVMSRTARVIMEGWVNAVL